MPDKFLPPPFRIEIAENGDGEVRIRPVGELDMSTAPELEASMVVVRAPGRVLVVDLSGLEFMDSTGLTLFTRWSLGTERHGYTLALVRGGERIQRLFELTGLVTHFQFVDG